MRYPFLRLGLLCCLVVMGAACSKPAADAPNLYERIEAKIAADPQLAERLSKPPPELQSVQWMLGTWDVTATVFATASKPQWSEQGTSTVSSVLAGSWLQVVDAYGTGVQDLGFLTYNPATRTWVAVALDSTGNAGFTTAAGWNANRLALTGTLTILGERVTLRQTIEKRSNAEYRVLNEEQLADGRWRALDEYHYRRRPQP